MTVALRILALIPLVVALNGLGGCASSPTQPLGQPASETTAADPIKHLRNAAHEAYRHAIAAHEGRLRASAPIITQRLLGMTLYRANGERIDVQMKDKSRYFLMAAASHPPLAIYSILSVDGFGPLRPETANALREYLFAIQSARAHLANADEDPSTAARLDTVLERSERYIESIVSRGASSEAGFNAYATAIRPLIQENLYVGAKEQLHQFMGQLREWRREFPDESWTELRVVVLGFHQPRDLYALKLLFQWLLQEPPFEHRVVFAEFQDGLTGDAAKKAEQDALILLTKVDFEQPLGAIVLGDPSAMGRDVMGPAAKEILQSWGQPIWP